MLQIIPRLVKISMLNRLRILQTQPGLLSQLAVFNLFRPLLDLLLELGLLLCSGKHRISLNARVLQIDGFQRWRFQQFLFRQWLLHLLAFRRFKVLFDPLVLGNILQGRLLRNMLVRDLWTLVFILFEQRLRKRLIGAEVLQNLTTQRPLRNGLMVLWTV